MFWDPKKSISEQVLTSKRECFWPNPDFVLGVVMTKSGLSWKLKKCGYYQARFPRNPPSLGMWSSSATKNYHTEARPRNEDSILSKSPKLSRIFSPKYYPDYVKQDFQDPSIWWSTLRDLVRFSCLSRLDSWFWSRATWHCRALTTRCPRRVLLRRISDLSSWIHVSRQW